MRKRSFATKTRRWTLDSLSKHDLFPDYSYGPDEYYYYYHRRSYYPPYRITDTISTAAGTAGTLHIAKSQAFRKFWIPVHGVLACARSFNVFPAVFPTIAESLGSTRPALYGVSITP